MAKVLLVSASPHKEKGFTEQILDKALFNSGIEIEPINLYDQKLPFFRDDKEIPEIVSSLFAKFVNFDQYIFLFPVWWSNMPAVLKNFFDWGIHFGIDWDRKSNPESKLEGKKALVICSAGDEYDQNEKNEVIHLVSQVLEMWGVDVFGEVFIDGTYDFSDEMYLDNIEVIQKFLKEFR